MIRRLALYGDEQEQHSDARMTERVLQLIGKREPRVGYVPEASYPDRRFFEVKRAYYAGIGAELAAYFDKESADGERAALFACDAIHLSGGNTFMFLYWLQQRSLLPQLREYVARGGVLIGVSAGSILMTPSVHAAALCGDPPDPRLTDYRALDLVGFHFWPHFDPGRVLDAEAVALAASLPELYACGGGAAIVVDGRTRQLYGAVQPFRSRSLERASD